MRNLVILSLTLLSIGCAHKSDSLFDPPTSQSLAVVFDIDGTLTPGVYRISEARKGAVDAVRIFAEKGYKIIYLSHRGRVFQGNLLNWFQSNDFPAGGIHVPQTAEDERDAVAYKIRILREYQDRGWQLKFAFGDSTTDFIAYREVKIPNENIFALRRENQPDCQWGSTTRCINGWTDHLKVIRKY
jgi:hypothetical protein